MRRYITPLPADFFSAKVMRTKMKIRKAAYIKLAGEKLFIRTTKKKIKKLIKKDTIKLEIINTSHAKLAENQRNKSCENQKIKADTKLSNS